MSDGLLSDAEEQALILRINAGFAEMDRRRNQLFYGLFPDDGDHRRELYPRHMEFFAAGADFPERLFMAANRVGKTIAGAFEVACHLTGLYPHWWVGRRFSEPGEWWACGTTNETTRDIVQRTLFGKHEHLDTAEAFSLGMVPAHLIAGYTRRPHGLTGSLESVKVKHSNGKTSMVGLKTYEQGRKSFEGTAKQGIWDDEEPPIEVYQEQVLRTMTTGGIVIVTFTPLQGMSDVVKSFLEPESDDAAEFKIYIQAGWDDVPHLTEADKKRQIATMLPYQIAARTKGEPSLGSGAIYPIPESDIVVPAFHIPDTWARAYGMDVGWNRTAVAFVAEEPTTGNYIVYDEHYKSTGEPPSHAMAIRSRGTYLDGVIDPAARGRSQKDGSRLIDSYCELGLNLHPADNAVETGLLDMWTMMISGRFRVFGDRCPNWVREFRKYHRDEKGAIVKKDDHLMDATRYWARSGRDRMKAKPRLKAPKPLGPERGRGTWMQS